MGRAGSGRGFGVRGNQRDTEGLNSEGLADLVKHFELYLEIFGGGGYGNEVFAAVKYWVRTAVKNHLHQHAHGKVMVA